MKTIQELEEERIKNQQTDAEDLIQKMFSFIPLVGEHPKSAILSAKYCAKVTCDYLIQTLPNINETPPNNRNAERTYKQYWKGVKYELENYKV